MARTRRNNIQRVSRAVIAFSPGNRLVSEDHFLAQLAPVGMTRRGFRSLCRALLVPTLELGSTRFLDAYSFSLALRAILRVGQPDFLAPGCTTLRKARTHPTDATTTLDPAYFEKHASIVIAELLSMRRFTDLKVTREVVDAAREASQRMALAGFQRLPLESQDALARRALRRFPDTVPEVTPDAPLTPPPQS